MKSTAIAFTVALSLAGCHQYVDIYPDHGPGYGRDRGGPPDHAPAHGYRKKYHDHDLMFDSGVGVYVVVGSPGFYFWDDFYWRLRDGIWIRASAFDGPWLVVEDTYHRLPPGLAKKHGYGKSEGKEKGKGKNKKKDY